LKYSELKKAEKVIVELIDNINTQNEFIYELFKEKPQLRLDYLLNKSTMPKTRLKNGVKDDVLIDERLSIVNELFNIKGDVYREYRAIIKYLNSVFDRYDRNDLIKSEIDRLYRDWNYKLFPLDKVVDYLVICKGSHLINRDGERVYCYNDRQLDRKWTPKPKEKLFRKEDGTYIKLYYTQEGIINYSRITAPYRKRHPGRKTSEMSDEAIIEKFRYSNGSKRNKRNFCVQPTIKSKFDLMNMFDDELEKRVADLIIEKCNWSDIKKTLKISEYRLGVIRENMKQQLKEFYSDEDLSNNKVIPKKQCKKCDEWKSIDLFVKDSNAKSGYRSVCKECDRMRYK